MKRRTFVAAASATFGLPAFAADPDPWQVLARQSLEYSGNNQKELESVHKFSTYPQWTIDLDKGEMQFTGPGTKPLVTKILVVGSLVQNTWRWGWGDQTFKPQITKEVEKVRAYGSQRAFQRLVEPVWQGQEADAWICSAISNFLLKGKGVYRAPMQNGMLFVVFTSVQKAT